MGNCIRFVVLCVIVAAFPSLALAAKTHRVKKSESLHSLAQKYHVTVDDIKSANNLVSNHLKSGDILVIPPRSLATAGEQASRTTYRVKKGESLSRIARRTGVSVAELKRLNGLKGQRVKPGKVLVLKEADTADTPVRKTAKRYFLKNPDLFDEKEYAQSLAELTEFDPDRSVDLTKNVELKVDTNIKRLKQKAYSFLGARYRFGGSSPTSLDCSSFVQQVFRQMDVQLPRTAREQFHVGNEVVTGNLQKGDLIFFRTYAPFPSHVGIYLGGNKMIHASSRDRRVVISSINTPYYRSRYIGAKRIAKINPDILTLDELLYGVEEEQAEEAEGNDLMGISLNN